MATFGENLRKCRKDAGLTQQQLADRLSCSKELISQYERGKLRPKIETVKRFADALSVEMDALEHIRLGGRNMDVKIDMTNQEAIEALQEYAISRGLPKKMVDAFGKAIRALEEQPEWISVSDRLPANANTVEKEYLVQFTNDGMTVLNYYDGWNCFVDNDGIYHNENEITNVLFWMELPKPKEVDEDDV